MPSYKFIALIFCATLGVGASRAGGESAWVLASRNSHSSSRNIVRRSVDVQRPEMQQFHVTSTINMKFSETTVKVKLFSPLSNISETLFSVELPEEAFISNFTLQTAHGYFVGEVMKKEDAEKVYEEAKKNQQSTGLVSDKGTVKRAGRQMTIFATAIALEAKSTAVIHLMYQQMLVRVGGAYESLISINPSQVVKDLRVEVFMYEPQGIQWLTVDPPYTGSNLVSDTSVTTIHESTYIKKLFYSPTVEEQKEADDSKGISGMLSIRYDVTATPLDGYVITDEQFFAYYFSPNETRYQPLSKSVAFVIDISGSMSGNKMRQTLNATLAILPQLRFDDKFMLLLFDDNLKFWPEQYALVAATPENVASAMEFARRNLEARGSTDINLGLTTACETLVKAPGERGSKLIVFLTDGQPTSGETHPDRILENVYSTSRKEVSIFALGFGEHVNFQLLEAVSYGTGGFPKKIYEDTDASLQLQDFFKEIGTPLMYNIQFGVSTGVESSGLYFPQYFAGSEIMIIGKMDQDAPKQWSLTMTANTARDVTFTKQVDTSVNQVTLPAEERVYRKAFMERLFVQFRIKDLLKERSATLNEDEKEKLKTYITQLALDYHLVTPYTSLVVVTNDTRANKEPDRGAEATRRNSVGQPLSGNVQYDLAGKVYLSAMSSQVLVISNVFLSFLLPVCFCFYTAVSSAL